MMSPFSTELTEAPQVWWFLRSRRGSCLTVLKNTESHRWPNVRLRSHPNTSHDRYESRVGTKRWIDWEPWRGMYLPKCVGRYVTFMLVKVGATRRTTRPLLPTWSTHVHVTHRPLALGTFKPSCRRSTGESSELFLSSSSPYGPYLSSIFELFSPSIVFFTASACTLVLICQQNVTLSIHSFYNPLESTCVSRCFQA